jgi:hypothetical protein
MFIQGVLKISWQKQIPLLFPRYIAWTLQEVENVALVQKGAITV